MPEQPDSVRATVQYSDLDIDPELVAAPALPDDEPLRLDEPVATPVYRAAAGPALSPGPAPTSEPAPIPEPGPTRPEAPTCGEAQVGEAAGSEGADLETPEATAAGTASPSKPRRRVARRRSPARSRSQQRHRRSVAAIVTRTLGTLTALAIVAGSGWALGWMPLPSFRAQAESVSVAPTPGEQIRVCPGPLQRLGLTSSADEITAVGTPDLATTSSGGEPKSSNLTGTDQQGTGPSIWTLPGTSGNEITQLTAAQSLAVEGADTNGFSATACMSPAPVQWLVAGDTTVGHTLVLDVVNPGNVEARVNFRVLNQDGLVSPSIPEALVGPGERTEISLAGISPDAASLAIEVTATGAEVAAYLHETVTSTLDPVGSDIVGASALPSTEQVVPGLYVYERTDIGETEPTDKGTALRFVNPNDEVANTVVTLTTLSGEVADTIELPLPANSVIDYPVTSVGAGEFTVGVESDQPVTVSGRVAPLDPTEFGWVPSSPQLSDEVLVAVPDGPDAQLAVANLTDEPREITLNGETLTLAAGVTYMREVAGEVDLRDVDGLYAAVHYSGDAGIASFPVQPGNADAEPVEVLR